MNSATAAAGAAAGAAAAIRAAAAAGTAAAAGGPGAAAAVTVPGLTVASAAVPAMRGSTAASGQSRPTVNVREKPATSDLEGMIHGLMKMINQINNRLSAIEATISALSIDPSMNE